MNDIITYLERSVSEPSLGGATHRGNVRGSGLMIAPSDRGRCIFGRPSHGSSYQFFLADRPIRIIVTGKAEDLPLDRNLVGSKGELWQFPADM